MQNLNLILNRLINAEIDFVLIGGYAGIVHGSTQVTQDIDICAALTKENIEKLRKCLKDANPIHRMNSNFKPSFLDYPEETESLNAIYLETDFGILDILASVTAVGNFETVKQNAVEIEVFGRKCFVISLDDLIQVKSHMGREKDKLAVRELLAIKKEFE